MQPPQVGFRTQRRVEFRDTDAAGIVHFSAFFPMMESAEHEWLRALGTTVMPSYDMSQRLTFPRVAASCDYLGPARFEDVLDICVRVEKLGRTSITYGFEISCRESPIANGRLTVVCCYLAADGRLEKTDVPKSLRDKLS